MDVGVSRLYFVGGTFGSGKSTLCLTLSQRLPATHLKASELIRYIPDPKDTTGKATDYIADNQERLIAALAMRRSVTGITILDGHFCLLDNNCTIVRLSLEVFQRIQPSALVLVECNPHEIAERLMLRDGREMDHILINNLQRAEREHGIYISKVLNVPIMIANKTSDVVDILTFLRSSSQV